MGKGKTEIEKTTQLSFTKRRGGLMKKARELSVLCDADVAVIIYSSTGQLFKFSSSCLKSTLSRYNKCLSSPETASLESIPEIEVKTDDDKPNAAKEDVNQDFDKTNKKEDFNQDFDKTNMGTLIMRKKLDVKDEPTEIDILKQDVKMLKWKHTRLLGQDGRGVGLKELLQFDQQLNGALLSIKERKERILMDQLKQSRMKEQLVVLENETLRKQVEELRGFCPPTGHTQPLSLEYYPLVKNPVAKDSAGGPETLFEVGVKYEVLDTTLRLGYQPLV